MACLAMNFTAVKRRKLAKILFILHFLCAACGIAFFGLGIYIKIGLLAWMKLIDGYNDNLLPLMLIIVGTLLVVIDVAGGRLVLSAEKSARVRYLLIPYLCIMFILCFCILGAGIICFVHQGHLSKAFHRGLTHAMQQYKDDVALKSKIDFVQMELKCCGNLGYEDWFDVQWINNEYIDLDDLEVQSKMTNGQFLNDDTPFSCCDPKAPRHCVHHHVQDNDMHYNYDYQKDLTLFSVGCKEGLMGYYRVRLGNVGAIVMAMFGLQAIMLIGVRYLQTAVHDSSKDSEGDSKGYLFDTSAKEAIKSGKKNWKEKTRRDVESGDAGEESGGSASASGNEPSGDGSAADSFDSDSFDSPEEADAGDAQAENDEEEK